MKNPITNSIRGRTKGAALPEYIILFALLGMLAIPALVLLGGETKKPYEDGIITLEGIEIPDVPPRQRVVVVTGGGTEIPIDSLQNGTNELTYEGCAPPGATWDPARWGYVFHTPVFFYTSNPNHRDRLVVRDTFYKIIHLPITERLSVYTDIRGVNTTNTADWWVWGYDILPHGLYAPGAPECSE